MNWKNNDQTISGQSLGTSASMLESSSNELRQAVLDYALTIANRISVFDREAPKGDIDEKI